MEEFRPPHVPGPDYKAWFRKYDSEDRETRSTLYHTLFYYFHWTKSVWWMIGCAGVPIGLGVLAVVSFFNLHVTFWRRLGASVLILLAAVIVCRVILRIWTRTAFRVRKAFNESVAAADAGALRAYTAAVAAEIQDQDAAATRLVNAADPPSEDAAADAEPSAAQLAAQATIYGFFTLGQVGYITPEGRAFRAATERLQLTERVREICRRELARLQIEEFGDRMTEILTALRLVEQRLQQPGLTVDEQLPLLDQLREHEGRMRRILAQSGADYSPLEPEAIAALETEDHPYASAADRVTISWMTTIDGRYTLMTARGTSDAERHLHRAAIKELVERSWSSGDWGFPRQLSLRSTWDDLMMEHFGPWPDKWLNLTHPSKLEEGVGLGAIMDLIHDVLRQLHSGAYSWQTIRTNLVRALFYITRSKEVREMLTTEDIGRLWLEHSQGSHEWRTTRGELEGRPTA